MDFTLTMSTFKEEPFLSDVDFQQETNLQKILKSDWKLNQNVQVKIILRKLEFQDGKLTKHSHNNSDLTRNNQNVPETVFEAAETIKFKSPKNDPLDFNSNKLLEDLTDIVLQCEPNCSICCEFINQLSVHIRDPNNGHVIQQSPSIECAKNQASSSNACAEIQRSPSDQNTKSQESPSNQNSKSQRSPSNQNPKCQWSPLGEDSRSQESAYFSIQDNCVKSEKYSFDEKMSTAENASSPGEALTFHAVIQPPIVKNSEQSEPNYPEQHVGSHHTPVGTSDMNSYEMFHISENIKDEPEEEVIAVEDPLYIANSDGDRDRNLHGIIKTILDEPIRPGPDTREKSKPFYCSLCNLHFSDITILIDHNDRLHRPEDDPIERPHKCDTCGNRFRYKGQLAIHMRIHTPEKNYQCGTCGIRFRYITKFTEHIEKHKVLKTHQCKICAESFRCEPELVEHSKEHNIVAKLHKCGICGKCYQFESRLNLHKKSHTSEKRNECEICGKKLRKSSLTLHMRIHTGERPFGCSFCDKRFSQKCALNKHLQCHARANSTSTSEITGLINRHINETTLIRDAGVNNTLNVYVPSTIQSAAAAKKHRQPERTTMPKPARVGRIINFSNNSINESTVEKGQAHDTVHSDASGMDVTSRRSDAQGNLWVTLRTASTSESEMLAPADSVHIPDYNMYHDVHEVQVLSVHDAVAANRYSCDVCGVRLFTRFELQQHIVQVHGH